MKLAACKCKGSYLYSKREALDEWIFRVRNVAAVTVAEIAIFALDCVMGFSARARRAPISIGRCLSGLCRLGWWLEFVDHVMISGSVGTSSHGIESS